jgi:hypothetical protein
MTFWEPIPEITPEEGVEMRERKHVLCPARLRRVPRQFSWVDQRLVRDGHIGRCGSDALALYLFMATVADADGLSYYSDTTAARLLTMDRATLSRARRELTQAGLIAYQSPLYQVLSLDDPGTGLSAKRRLPVRCTTGEAPLHRSDEAMSIGEVLRQVIGGAA